MWLPAGLLSHSPCSGIRPVTRGTVEKLMGDEQRSWLVAVGALLETVQSGLSFQRRPGQHPHGNLLRAPEQQHSVELELLPGLQATSATLFRATEVWSHMARADTQIPILQMKKLLHRHNQQQGVKLSQPASPIIGCHPRGPGGMPKAPTFLPLLGRP